MTKHETYGFNSTKSPPPIPHMLNFENRLINMINNVKFRKSNCNFQNQPSADIRNIKRSKLVPADKTTNFYQTESDSYNELLQKNITKTYKKVSHTATSSIEHETKSIVQKLNFDDRVRTTAEKDAFITLKDHKPNFDNIATCRLINPTKSEIGKISKQILVIDRINKEIITTALNLNQLEEYNCFFRMVQQCGKQKPVLLYCI